MRLLLILALALTAVARAAERPHVVLFIADDHTWHDCGPYGAKDVRTPNLDRLAAEGMKFNLAFAPSPTCTPSRSAIYTGLYPFRNGAHANHSLINADVKTWPEHFKELGYRVVLAGKTHIGPRERFPFEYLQGSNVMPEGKNHVLWTDLSTVAIEKLLASHDHKARPLCLIVCSHSPHVYWPENDGYDAAKLNLPPYLLDTSETRAVRARYYTDVSWMDRQLGEVMAAVSKHGEPDNTLLLYTADQGAQFPFAKWNLYDAGIRAPLIVRWPGKIKPATTTDALVSLVDLLPTLMQAAGAEPPKDIDGQSFLPVLLGQTNTHRTEAFAAHTGDAQMNRSPMRAIRTARYKYILNLAPDTRYETHISKGAGPDGRSYWNSWLKLAESDAAARRLIDRYHTRPAEELYEVEADPHELQNLANDPAHAATLTELREKLKSWRLAQGEDLTKVPLPEDARTGNVPYAR